MLLSVKRAPKACRLITGRLLSVINDDKGNAAIFFVLSLLPAILLMGGAIDIMRTNGVKSQIRSAVDSAVLAAAGLSQNGDAETVVKAYIDANTADISNLLENLSIDVSAENEVGLRRVSVDLKAELNTFFPGLTGRSALSVDYSATAEQILSKVELSLVLDVSSSMRGARLVNLKSAAEEFITMTFDGQLDDDVTSMSIIPFGGTVNIGETLFNKFAKESKLSNTDPSETDYSIGSGILDAGFRFSNGDYCLEYKNEDYNDGSLLREGEHGQVPHFWRWWNFHPWCPDETSGAIFNSADRDLLVNHIRGLTLSDGTGSNDGVLWGLNSLSPAWVNLLGGDYDDRPAAYDDELTTKAMIIMSDGAITGQNRPQDYTLLNVHTDRPSNNVPVVSSHGDQGNRQNMQTSLSRGGTGNALDVDRAVPHFRRVCAEAKAQGILIFTIGFQINEGSLPDILLEECATSPSTYYFVEGLNLETAFSGISARLSNLRITG